MNKNIILLVTDLVNFEECLPMAYFLGKNLYLIDLNDVIKDSNYSKELISKVNIIVIKNKNSLAYNLLSFFNKVLFKLNLSIKFLDNFVFQLRLNNYDKVYFNTINSIIEINSISHVLIRPNNDILVGKIIKRYKAISKHICIIGISQAIPALTNLIQYKDNISMPSQKKFFHKDSSLVYYCNKIISNSKTTTNIYKKINIDFMYKIFSLKSLRNTYEWQQLIVSDYYLQNKKHANNSQIKVLLLHSNFISNINHEEVRRSIRIINQYDNFEIGIRPHIRFGSKKNNSEVKYLFNGIKNYKIFSKSLMEGILWSDICIFYGSSAAVDAISQNKDVIYLRYATSCSLDEELEKNIHICDNPDEFMILISSIMNSNLPSKVDYTLSNAELLTKQWKKLLELK
tara:strand:- start:510 stop:1709 length:1200 start_codon:yes stop_codon:yes gene_type:complete